MEKCAYCGDEQYSTRGCVECTRERRKRNQKSVPISAILFLLLLIVCFGAVREQAAYRSRRHNINQEQAAYRSRRHNINQRLSVRILPQDAVALYQSLVDNGMDPDEAAVIALSVASQKHINQRLSDGRHKIHITNWIPVEYFTEETT